MEDIIRFLLSNFTLTFLVLGLLAAGAALLRAPGPLRPPVVVEALFAYFLLFSIGGSFLYNFVMHTFFGETAARFIGWETSPFQAEVGFASLGFALVGLLAFRGDSGLRLAAVVGPAAFLLGAAAGHVHQMITARNFAPGNAGVIFYTDILIPLVGLALLRLQHRHGRPRPRAAMAAA
ncbi:DUF6790 family protein [Crenalkalicoccus roseus]|uniref:DUF6790 family protein n=1 Tax=Crenalkalicoccus roseus TaxID=1485588 RepID=UPI00108098AC|nr:DUF6790 family protein [Crenalkalicoccus roseus]